MTLVEHLEELRKTLIRVVFIVVGAFFIAYSFGQYISDFLLMPLRAALASQNQLAPEMAQGQIVYLGILDKVISQLQVAFWTSLIISSPLWFWQIWKFIKPGLHEFEVKAVRPFLLVGFFLFIIGVSFGYFVVFPITFETLMTFGVDNVAATISLKEYLVLSSKVLVFLGLVFQLPNILLILGFMGLVTKYSLKEKRRYIYVGFAVLSAVMTPPDIITMMGLWFPLVCLFEVGVLAVALVVLPYLARQHSS